LHIVTPAVVLGTGENMPDVDTPTVIPGGGSRGACAQKNLAS
jgi:hypothetical protein